jgi:hypothetical protein
VQNRQPLRASPCSSDENGNDALINSDIGGDGIGIYCASVQAEAFPEARAVRAEGAREDDRALTGAGDSE